MLVLSRKRDERVVIDPRMCPPNELGLIELLVVEIRGDKVRLGIEAPRAVPVHRKEVWDSVRQQPEPELEEEPDIDSLWIDEGNPVG